MDNDFNNGSFNRDLDTFYDASLTPVELLADARYSDEEFIASGAIKSVYKVTDNHCARDVALARIKKGAISLSHAHDFIREVQLTSSLEHPNIIRVYDIGIEHSAPWFTMELTSSQTLADYIQLHPDLSLNDKLDIVLQLCDAIAYAHENDILHLDLKPENVTIGAHQQPILCDWGISSSISNLPEKDLEKLHTRHGYIKGSPGYMAPEQASPSYRKAPAADIFGIGGLLHYLLTNEPPIQGANSDEKLEHTKAGNIAISTASTIPTRLRPVLERALARSASERYGCARELQQDIQAFRDGFATDAEAPSFFTLFSLFVQRNKVATGITATLTVLILGLTLYYIGSLKESKHREITARKNAELAQVKTQQTLDALLAEQRARIRANDEFSQMLVKNNRTSLSDFNFKLALRIAKDALRRSPKSKEAMMQLGYTHFLRFEFKAAAHYLKLSQMEDVTDLHDIAMEFQTHSGPLSGDQVISIFQQTTRNRDNLKSLMLHHYAKTSNRNELLKVVMHLLALRNEAHSLRHHFDQQKGILNLTGNPQLQYYDKPSQPLVSGYNFLALLKLKKLILDDTAHNRKQLEKLKVELSCSVELESSPTP